MEVGSSISYVPLLPQRKDPQEDFDYNDPRYNPLLRLVAARTPRIYHCTPARKFLTTSWLLSWFSPQLVSELVCTELVSQLVPPFTGPLYNLVVLSWISSGFPSLYQLSCPMLDQLGRPLTVLAWNPPQSALLSALIQSAISALIQLASELLHYSSSSPLLLQVHNPAGEPSMKICKVWDELEYFRMRPVLSPPKRSNE
ncbi:hypothetical protein F511_07875 [Dorcoceras hygrometricum]|uniref:Uncharacterized protein n=1 Tax=Dorcoceras hygrometricum TaxID=472368 RepID=A0A2Z7CJH2_9LAMI|nr:hypothetical protein F511_07875 [Dorcoceras hygrometricum]